jgi:hypothetical protein
MMPVMSVFGRVISRCRARRRPAASPDARPTPVHEAELRAALLETAHERDVSIARASEAEEHARLADERLQALAALERRVHVAERRALDAERRLDEISEQIYSAPDESSDDEPAGESGPTAELRARLTRAAEHRLRNPPKPGPG